MNPPNTVLRILKKTGRIVLKTVLILLGVLILLLILVQTPPVQNFLRGKAQDYLQKKLQTRVEIGRVYIGFPKKIVLERLYVEDRRHDTLLYSGELKVNMNMWKLFRNEIVINDVSLKQLTATINRTLPDTVYNFQFIIDAFASPPKAAPSPPDTSALSIQLKHITLDDIHLRYNDAITGNDMKVHLAHFETNVDTFDPSHSIFDIPVANIDGLRANMYQHKPLVEPSPVAAEPAEPQVSSPLQLRFKKIALNNCYLEYGNDGSAFFTTLDLGKLAIEARQIDLAHRQIDLGSLSLVRSTAIVRLGKRPAARSIPKVKNVKQEIPITTGNDWTVKLQQLDLSGNHVRFDDDNAPHTKYGMDYMHLDLRNLTLVASNLFYQPDSMTGTISKGALQEKGFRLNRLQTEFLYSAKQAYLKDLLLETPGTRIERDIIISYPSIDALADHIGLMKLNMDLRNTRVINKDILTFAPMLRSQPMFANPDAYWSLNGKVSGSIDNLQMNGIKLQGLHQTSLDLKGTLKGLPDMNKLQANLTITQVSTTAKDLKALLPAGAIPANITLPANLKLSGMVSGSQRSLTTDLSLVSSIGAVGIKGTAYDLTDSNNVRYDLTLNTRSLDLQKLLNQPDLGPVSLQLTAKGKGRVPKTMDAAIDGTIASFTYKNYTYQNLHLNGSIAQQLFRMNAGIQNEPIHLSIDADGSMAENWPSARFHIVVDSIKTQPLHFTTDKIIYRGDIAGDFSSTNPDSLDGQLFITKSLLIRDDQRFQLDTIQLLASNSDTGQSISLNSELVSAKLYGKYRLTQAGNIFQKSIDPYFSIMPDSTVVDSNYDFRISATVHDNPQLRSLLPDLQKLEPILLNGHFSGNGDVNALIDVPGLIYGSNQVHQLQVTTKTEGKALKAKLSVERINVGKSVAIYDAALNSSIANNTIDFALNTRDKAGKTNYHLEGILSQQQKDSMLFSLKPDSLLLNYQSWNVHTPNRITITPNQIGANNFILNQGDQQMAIGTIVNKEGQPLGVDFSKFRLATLTSFVQPDSLLVNGELNGNITLHDLTKAPAFVSDLTVDNLSLHKDTLGNLRAQVSNPEQNKYVADIALSGRGNDLTVKGNYLMQADSNSRLDLKLAIQQLQLSTLEGISMGNIKRASGAANGHFDITGSPAKPSVNGELNFNKARFIPAIMGSFVSIDQQSIKVTPNGILFNNFTITDSVNNKATLDGTVYTVDYANYRFDLQFNADNFQALNTVKKDNNLYFGKLFFNSRLQITGTDLHPVVDGNLKINDKTHLTIILPQEDPAVVDREGIVRFVDRNAALNDSLFPSSYDSLNTSAIRDFDISVNISVDKNAEFNLIIDEGNGDLLKVKGEANLNGGIDPSGKVTLTGSYELQEGSYDLTVNFLKRKFNIQKGSKIIWQGEPTKANLDITAIYIAKTAPIDLVEKTLGNDVSATERNTYRQKVPFEVHLIMKGELLKPSITFDILLPDDKNYNVDKRIITASNDRLTDLRREPSELNKQVFALLLLNRFIGDNPFASGNSSLTAESFARQSVSKLLSEQLNQLAANLIEGVDINFDLATSDDYTTGERRNRTDLNVAISKRLLNDRLTVTVGSNFALENPNASQQSNNLAENIALDYRLSKDGRYMLRAYRKNQFEGVLEGYIIETGVGIVITLDYNRFRDIFRSKKERERIRLQRQQEREKEKADKPPVTN